jgi:integral membrane sensor domain MASE1
MQTRFAVGSRTGLETPSRWDIRLERRPLGYAGRVAAAMRASFASSSILWFAAPRGKYVIELAFVFSAYLLCGKIGLIVPFTTGNISPVWPAAGVAMAALLLVGYRVWPAIAAAAFLVNLFTPVPALAALGIAAGNTVGPLAGASLTRYISRFSPRSRV